MILIGITGRAGAGKDTVADFLVREYGFVKLSVAGPLKRMLAAAGLTEPADREDKEKSIEGFDFTWRQAAQALGTEWGRSLDPSLWVKILAKEVRNLERMYSATGARVVISDIRYDNEAYMVRELGGQVMHILGRAADLGQAADHASEDGVLYFPRRDKVLVNDGTLQDLYRKVPLLLKESAE